MYIFEYDGSSNWVEQYKIPGKNSGDKFGNSVAVDSDSSIVVGAPGSGSIYKYSYEPSKSIWEETTIRTPGSESGRDGWGREVAVDAGVIVAGAGFGQQAVYVNENGRELYISATNSAVPDWFRLSVAISGDTIVVGAPFFQEVYVYHKIPNEGSWKHVRKFTSNANGFGWDVAISGSTILVGAPRDNKVLIYQANYNGQWKSQPQTEVILNDAESSDAFGMTLAISGDNLAFGSPRDDNGKGSVFIYKGAL